MNRQKLLFSVIFLFLCVTSVYSQDRRIPVVVYHHVVEGHHRSDFYLKPEIFRDHLNWLQKNGYETVTFKEVYEQGLKLPKNPVILTFDDGAKDHWAVYKELQSRGMKGTFFIVSGHLTLSEGKIKEMSKNGMEIGSHTVNHLNLAKLSSKDLWYEINNSKITLEQMLGSKVIVMAYPYGLYNENVLSAMKMSDYIYGRTTDEYITSWGKGRNFRLPVILIRRNTRLLRF